VPDGHSPAQALVEGHFGGEERVEQAKVGDGQVEDVDLGGILSFISIQYQFNLHDQFFLIFSKQNY
jgi:hypothetical protein